MSSTLCLTLTTSSAPREEDIEVRRSGKYLKAGIPCCTLHSGEQASTELSGQAGSLRQHVLGAQTGVKHLPRADGIITRRGSTRSRDLQGAA